MKILHLTLNKLWYELIDINEKDEEYRDIKQYWVSRLVDEMSPVEYKTSCSFTIDDVGEFEADSFVHFDVVEFRNGYSKTARRMRFKISSISVGTGHFEWGAEPGKQYFVIKLGERISIWKP